MKKRRELDALVTNGKLPRRKSKSGHELLRSNDSDSSEVEEFSVPIGNKTGKKWIGICPCSSCVALLVFIVMTSCLIACGGLIWMHFELKRDLDNLRERLVTVENRNQGTPEEFQKYHSQMQDLNRTVHNIRTGDKGLDKLAKNLTQLTSQFSNLDKVTTELKDGLKDAPYLKSLPTKFEALTSTVVTMGSDIQLAQGKIVSLEEFKKKAIEDLEVLKRKVTDMENKTQTSNMPLGGREHGFAPSSDNDKATDVKDKLQMLALDIDTLNNTLTSRLGTLNSTLLQYETRLSLLENFTSQKTTAVGSDDSSANALKQLLKGGSDSPSDGDMTTLTSVLKKVDNITDMVVSLGLRYDKLQSDITSVNKSVKTTGVKATGSVEGMEQFAAFQTHALTSMEYLNSTVLKLTDSVEQLFRLFTKNRNELNNVTAHVNGILNYMSLGAGDLHITSTTTTATTAAATAATAAHQDKVVTTTTASPKTVTTTMTSETSSPPAPIIKLKTVQNMSDLKLNFNRWDRNGVGQVDPEDLQDYMPDPPTPEQLKPFDADNNGRYSLEEMAVALGFKTDTSKEMENIFE